MSRLKDVVGPRISADLRRPEIEITPHFDLAASMGVTTQTLSQVIRIATQGEINQNSAKFSLSDRQIPIRVKLPIESRRDMTTLENLPVPTVTGDSVPLSRVASIGFGSGPTSIQRYNQSRRVFVGADLPPNVSKGTAMDEINRLPIMLHLPDGVVNKAAGEDRFQEELMRNFGAALGAGILLVFSVLVLLYHRFISPLVNMGSLFLAPLGGLLLLAITGNSISLPVFIGILMLFGIVAKNSILLIDFALEEMTLGKPRHEAITEAGPQTRAADRDDHGGNGCGHDPDRVADRWRWRLARADGHRGDRRAVAVDTADAADRAGRVQPGRRAGKAGWSVAGQTGVVA